MINWSAIEKDSSNPGRQAVAGCRAVEARLEEVITEITQEPDLGLRFEAAAILVVGLVEDASLEGVEDSIHSAEQLLFGNTTPAYAGCFDEEGHIVPDDLSLDDAEIDRTCLAIALIKQKAIRKWLLTSLVACARHDVQAENWQGQIEWFVRQAEGQVDWAPSKMGNVNFKVEMRPVEDAVALPPDAGAVH